MDQREIQVLEFISNLSHHQSCVWPRKKLGMELPDGTLVNNDTVTPTDAAVQQKGVLMAFFWRLSARSVLQLLKKQNAKRVTKVQPVEPSFSCVRVRLLLKPHNSSVQLLVRAAPSPSTVTVYL